MRRLLGSLSVLQTAYAAEPQLKRFGVFCCRDNEPAKLGKIALTVRGLRRRSSR